MYAKGFYVQQDFSKAVYWFSKAASKDFPMALFNLAVSYTKGEGVEKDEVEGGRLFNLSGSLGFALANTGYFDFEEDPLYNPDYVPKISPIEEYTL